MRRFAILFLALPLSAQAVLLPTEDATIAPKGALRFRVDPMWQHYDNTLQNDSLQVLSYYQTRVIPISLELGLSRRLSLSVVAPAVNTLVNTSWFSQQMNGLRLDSILQHAHDGIGDIETGGKFSWLAGPDEHERIALTGFHARSSVSAFYRFTTGIPPAPGDYFGVATGSGRHALTAASQTDLMFGPWFWFSAVARYQWQGPTSRDVQLYANNDPLQPPLGVVTANLTGGNEWTLSANPKVSLGRYFGVGLQYTYRHRDQTHFAGTRDTSIAGDSLTLDASTLDSASAGTAQYLGGTVTYSTVAAWLQGKVAFPIEISYQYVSTIASTGSFPKQAATNIVTVRLWIHMWGDAFSKAKKP